MKAAGRGGGFLLVPFREAEDTLSVKGLLRTSSISVVDWESELAVWESESSSSVVESVLCESKSYISDGKGLGMC